MATNPNQTGGKGATAITDATRSLTATIESLNKTLRTLNVNFDSVNDTADEVEKLNKKHHKTLERLQKLTVANATSLRDLVQQQHAAAEAFRKQRNTDAALDKQYVAATRNNLTALAVQTKTIISTTKELVADHSQTINDAKTRREEERKLTLDSKRTLNDLASGVTSANTAFNSIAGDLTRVQDMLTKKLADVEALKQDEGASVTEMDALSAEIQALTLELAELSDKSAQISDEYERASTVMRDRMSGVFDSMTADQLKNALSADQDRDVRIQMLDALVASNDQWLSQQVDAANRQSKLADLEEQSDIRLNKTVQDLAVGIQRLNNEVYNQVGSLQALQEQYEDASLVGNLEEMERLGAEIVTTTASIQSTRERLIQQEQDHGNAAEVLGKRYNVLGKISESLGNHFKNLASGALAGKAAGDMYADLQWQASHGVASTIGEVFVNYTDAIMSGISSRVYQEALAASKTSQLTAKSQGQFRDALESSTDTMFQFTINRDEAARISADMYEAMAKSGIGADKAKQGMEALAPVMGKLSRATGKSIQEIAKMTAALYEDNDFRLGMIGMQEHEKQQRVEAILLSEQLLMANGYTLEQTREMSRAAARRDLVSTLSGRVKTGASLEQMMAMVSNLDPSQAAKWAARRDEMAGVRVQLRDQSLSDEERQRLQAEIKRLEQLTTTELQSAATEGAQKNQYVNDSTAYGFESVRDRLNELETSGDQALIATGKQRSASGEQEVASGAKGAGDSAIGSIISKMQSIYAAGTSSPVVFIASVVTALATSKVLGKAAGALPEFGKKLAGMAGGAGGKGGIMGWLGDAAKSPAVRGAVGKVGIGAVAGLVGGVASDYAESKGHHKTAAGIDVASTAATGAALGSIVAPGIGTIIGGALGGAYGVYDNWGKFTGSGANGSPSDIVSKPNAPLPSATLAAKPEGPTTDPAEQENYFRVMSEQLTKLVNMQNQLLPDQVKLTKLQLGDLESVSIAANSVNSSFPQLFGAARG